MAILLELTHEAREAMPERLALCGDCEDEVGTGELYLPEAAGQVLLCADCAEARAEATADETRDAYRHAQRRLIQIQADRFPAV